MNTFGSLLFVLGGVAAELAPPSIQLDADNSATAFLFQTPETEADKAALNKAFLKIMKQLDDSFDHDKHNSFLAEAHSHAESFKNSLAYTGYKASAAQAECGEGSNAVAISSGNLGAFPGGSTASLGGFGLTGLVDRLSAAAAGPASAAGGIGGVIGSVALGMTAGFVQELVATAVHIVPPMVPPPVWNNQPLMCLPMVTGKNCLGAIFHTITTADFITADIVDARLDSVIASFPNTFQEKVGPAPKPVYAACFSAYMSMQCASIFPKCMGPQTGNDITSHSAQRMPMCFQYCISTLLACPGFWIDDIIGSCQDVGVVPACSTAFFWNLDLMPPQLASFEGALPSASACPSDLGLEEAAAGALGGAGGAGASGAGAGGAGTVGTARVPSIGM
jgi:hypothetical protein